MIYFKQNNEVIEKYQVNFDKEEILELKKQIIDDCSCIKHYKHKSDYEPRFSSEIIRNYRYTKTDEKKEYFEETRDVYLYEYDEYIPPHLVSLIDELLSGNEKIIDKILNYDISFGTTIDDKINLKNKEFNNTNNISKKREKLKELEELLVLKELNKNQQSIEPYYEELLKQINFNLIDKISVDEVKKIESFLETNLFSKISNIKDKTLTKTFKKISE